MSDEDLRIVELSRKDIERLIEAVVLTASMQDVRILDALRYAALNGKTHVEA